MGKSGYIRYVELLEPLKGKTITLDQLKSLIMKHIGILPQTIAQALKVMDSTGLIKDIGNTQFKVQ